MTSGIISSCVRVTHRISTLLPRGTHRYKFTTKRKYRLIVTPIRYGMHNACIYNDLCHANRGEKASRVKKNGVFLSIIFQHEQKNLHHLVSSNKMTL